MNPSPNSKTQTSALTLAALGVVFGDIGTSPLYTLQTIFSADSQDFKRTYCVEHKK